MMKKHTVDDFNILTVLGKGLYGKVFLVREIETQSIYAMKVLKKSIIERKNKAHYVFSYRNILIELQHPFIIHFNGSFQNERKLYFLLEYCPGGYLYSLLNRKDKFTEEQAKFYTAQVLLALEYLHDKNVIYRDLKPENLLIDKEGYLRMTDFGLSKKESVQVQDKYSIIGTPEYMPPEVLLNDETSVAMDYWCLGCLIHELVTGVPPFSNENQNEMFEDIKNKPFKLEVKVSDQLRSLLYGLFVKDPKQRLGTKSVKEIKEHPWFSGVNWEALLNKHYKAPFVPLIKSNIDVSYYDPEFTYSPLESYQYSFAASTLNANSLFTGFSYQLPIEYKTEQEYKDDKEIKT